MTNAFPQFLQRREKLILAAILAAGLLIRLPFLSTDFRTTNDVEFYRRWARTIRASGLPAIDQEPTVNDPPVLLYAFGAASTLEARLGGPDDRLLNALLKLPAALADLLTASIIVWALRGRSASTRVLACGLYVFHSAVWYVSAHWGQTDSVYALFMVASVAFLERGRVPLAWAGLALAVASKPQGWAIAPLLLAVTLLRHGLQGFGKGLATAGGVTVMLSLPWLITGQPLDLLRPYLTILDRPPRLVVSAYSLWFLLHGGNVQGLTPQDRPAGLPVSYLTISLGLAGLLTALVVWLVLRRRNAPLALALAAGVLCLGYFMLLPQVHERYLFPALPFLLLAAAQSDGSAGQRGLWWAFAALSATFLFNLVTIASPLPSLWVNLIAPQPATPLVEALRALTLVAAAVNLAVLVGLVVALAGARVTKATKDLPKG